MKRILSRLALSAGVFLALLGGTEVVLRAQGYGAIPSVWFDPEVGTRFHPDSMYFVGGPRKWAMVLLSKALSWMAKTPITDSTSGFRSAGPRAITLFAQQYPAEYLGDTVGSLAIAIRNDLVIRETPVTMYYRAIGRPSKNALWSALYLGRASLALFVTLLQRRNPGKKDVR